MVSAWTTRIQQERRKRHHTHLDLLGAAKQRLHILRRIWAVPVPAGAKARAQALQRPHLLLEAERACKHGCTGWAGVLAAWPRTCSGDANPCFHRMLWSCSKETCSPWWCGAVEPQNPTWPGLPDEQRRMHDSKCCHLIPMAKSRRTNDVHGLLEQVLVHVVRPAGASLQQDGHQLLAALPNLPEGLAAKSGIGRCALLPPGQWHSCAGFAGTPR